MAKRRTKSKSSGSVKTVVVRERAAKPVVIRASAPAPVRRRRRSGGGGGRSHSIGGGTTGAMSPAKSGSLALGGFIYGFIEKNFGAQLPTMPVIGKSGTIAIAAYFLGGKSPGIVADVGNAASVIAGYSFGSTGRVSGIAPQVSGVAAQV